jgi:PhoH-like ATPase
VETLADKRETTETVRDKYFLLDTNLFLLDPDVISTFKPKKPGVRNHIVIPTAVLEELDNLKDEEDEQGRRTERARNAQQTLSNLEELVTKHGKSLQEGIPITERYFLETINDYELKHREMLEKVGLSERKRDNLILMIARCLQEKQGDKGFELVTEDKGLFAKASSLGIKVNNCKGLRAVSGVGSETKIYWGYRDIMEVPLDLFEELEGHNLNPNQLNALPKTGPPIYPWEFLRVYSNERPGPPILAVFDLEQKKIRKLYDTKGFYLKPKNFEQIFAIEALLNPNISLVHLMGRAGTGKTLLALAAGIAQLKKIGSCEELYSSVIVMRPPEPAGRQLGYLPGSKDEKLEEWMQPIRDNFRVFQKDAKIDDGDIKSMKEEGVYSETAHYAIRGRSINGAFVIIDEAQNLTQREVKLIITRAAEGTKVVLTGDYSQIDHPALNKYNNGLVHSSEKMKESGMSATVHLDKVERGPLAEAASRLL